VADRREIAAEIAAQFGDGGATVLAEADLGRSWDDVVAGLPDAVFATTPPGPHPRGELWLARLRDHWARAGQLRPAVAATRGLVRRRAARLGEDHPDTLLEVGALGALAERAGRGEDAGRLLEQAWRGLRSTAGGRDLRVAVVAEHAGAHYLRAEAFHDAEIAFEQAWRIRKELAPGTQAAVAGHLGDLWVRKGRVADAIPLLQESYELNRDKLGRQHARSLARGQALANALAQVDRDDEAEPVLRDLLAEARGSGDRSRVAVTAFQLGVALYRQRREEEGFRTIQESIQLTRELPAAHAALPHRLSVWSRLIRARGHVEESVGVLLEAIEAEKELHGDDGPEVAMRYVELSELLVQLGRGDEALGWLDPAVALLRGSVGDQHRFTWKAAELLGNLLYAKAEHASRMGDRDTARELKAIGSGLMPVLGPSHAIIKSFKALTP